MADTSKIGDLTVIEAADLVDPTHPINTIASSQFNNQAGLSKVPGRMYLKKHGETNYDLAIPLADGPEAEWLVFTDPNSSIVVKDLADLPAPVDNKILLDATKVYHIDGEVDLGVNSLIVPEEGCSIAALNGGRDVCKLVSHEDNYTMFVSPDGSYSGDVLWNELTFTVDGTNSKLVDLDNDGNFDALDITGVNFTSCTSLGDVRNYRQMLNFNVGYVFLGDGWTFHGTMAGGIAIVTSIAVSFVDFTLLNTGTALSIQGSVRSDINFLAVSSGSVFCDFAPSNIVNNGQFALTNVRTTATDIVPNFPSSDAKARIRNCVGIRDTYIGGEWTISATAATAISDPNELTKLAGTTTYDDLQWFTQTTDNAFVYASDQEIEVSVDAVLGFSGGNGDEIGLQIRQWDDSISDYIDRGPRFVITMDSGGKIQNMVAKATAVLNQNDRIEIWIENQTDTTNVTASLGGIVTISERQS